MFFHGNSFRKKDVNKAVDKLDCLPEAKVKLKNALLEYGRAHKAHSWADESLLLVCLPSKIQERWAAKTEKKLNSSTEALKSELALLPNAQVGHLLATIKIIKKDQHFEELDLLLHASMAVSVALLAGGITLLLSQLSDFSRLSHQPSFVPKISLPDWLTSFFSDPFNTTITMLAGAGLLVLAVGGHTVKKILDSEKAATLKRSMKAVLEEMHL